MSGARCLKCFALRPHLHVPKTGKCMRCKRPERMPEPSTQGRLAKPRCGVAEPVLKHPPRQWQEGPLLQWEWRQWMGGVGLAKFVGFCMSV